MSEAVGTIQVQEEPGSLTFTISEDLYPLDAIYGAAYLFVDRCWILLDRPADRQVSVRLTSKTDEPLKSVEGEFCNELLNQVLRFRIGESTRQIREYTMARAFFGDNTSASIDALLAELDDEELADDDLDIAVPWESSTPADAAAAEASQDSSHG